METTTQTPLPSSLSKFFREDCVSQECRDLLPTLPSEEGLITSSCYLYRGFWFETPILNAVLSCQNHFRAHKDDLILASFPKSGTTWLKAVTFALSRRFHHEGKDSTKQPHPLLMKNPHDLVPFLEMDVSDDNSPFTSPKILATHLPYSVLPQSIVNSECKVIYICRNPKDTFVSLWHFVNRIKQIEEGENCIDEVFDRFCRGAASNGPIWEHCLEYWKASLEMPSKVLFLKYEEMKERPMEVIRRLAEFIGCPFVEPEDDGTVNEILRMCSFETMSGLEVNKAGKTYFGMENRCFFRKGEVGDWKNLLSSEMIERIDRITDEKLHGSGLKF